MSHSWMGQFLESQTWEKGSAWNGRRNVHVVGQHHHNFWRNLGPMPCSTSWKCLSSQEDSRVLTMSMQQRDMARLWDEWSNSVKASGPSSEDDDSGNRRWFTFPGIDSYSSKRDQLEQIWALGEIPSCDSETRLPSSHLSYLLRPITPSVWSPDQISCFSFLWMAWLQ